jgi:thiamine-phosphate pyrophosphorylase
MPRLYLVTPPVLTDAALCGLAAILEGFDIACLRLALATTAEAEIQAAVEALRPLFRPRDASLVITDHFRLVAPLRLDGVHLTAGPRHVREARRALGTEAIVGAYARASRHDGMTAAEMGADYVSFGPLSPSPLGDGTTAPLELFEWWSEMIEIPVVAEGGITAELGAALAPHADFLALGDALWSSPLGPAAALAEIVGRL